MDILKQCDGARWEEYLDHFKREKVTDKALQFMECDANDDAQQIWKGLLPQLGVRVMFKTLWTERNQMDGYNEGAVGAEGYLETAKTKEDDGDV